MAEIRLQLRALIEQRAAGTVDGDSYSKQRAVLGKSALEALAACGPRVVFQTRYVALGIAGMLFLLGAGLYFWTEGLRPVDRPSGTEGAAGPIDHGPDMQTAIAKLAEKLRQHPEDAEGWVLLGRTYRPPAVKKKPTTRFNMRWTQHPATPRLRENYRQRPSRRMPILRVTLLFFSVSKPWVPPRQ